jgi:hypothetical protein
MLLFSLVTVFSLFSSFYCAYAATAEQWRGRSIYQYFFPLPYDGHTVHNTLIAIQVNH